ncbi:MAG: dipeptide epimerase [Phycisphaerae bacterium]|nr:dipeptide epimerase [Phycisphaerae bacterium]NUQ44925.1 dipeptide epimerase [Phycisphaerae bacterium]
MILTWRRARRTLKHPFETAHGRRDFQETVLVNLETHGITGVGEGCPSRLYGHTLESIEATLARIAPLLVLRDPFHIEHILDELLASYDDQRAAVAAVDMALHDWIGKRLDIPTIRWLGLDPARAPRTDITIGIDAPETIARKVREAAGFPCFKVKVGVPNELEILRTIRREAPDTPMRVDANCGWTADDAETRMRAVCEFGVELVEQPVAADDHATLRRLCALRLAPIIADESCIRPADVPKLAGVVDGVNIKLNKCGGIREARKMIYLARTVGLRVMLGCTSESSVGVAAAAQLAPLADWIDLDTHLLVTDDPFEGLGGDQGRLAIGAGPGLGVRPDATRIVQE